MPASSCFEKAKEVAEKQCDKTAIKMAEEGLKVCSDDQTNFKRIV
jgi:hypothetical protein